VARRQAEPVQEPEAGRRREGQGVGVASPPEFEDTFDESTLDPGRWLPWYLPQWSSRERAAARYEVGGGRLRLLITADQEPWCPHLDGETRVSSLQTGVFAGPLGSGIGQHRFDDRAVVTEEQPELRLYTPLYGRVELRARIAPDATTMGALWLIGFEDEPERSGEICICELFGRDAGTGEAGVGMGIHPFHDPTLTDDHELLGLPIDVAEPHVYAAAWAPGRVSFSVDGETVKTVEQAPDYPMQLMLNVYEFPESRERPPAAYPKVFEIDYVRGYSLDG
jgi:glycosyl hydrolase family 16